MKHNIKIIRHHGVCLRKNELENKIYFYIVMDYDRIKQTIKSKTKGSLIT